MTLIAGRRFLLADGVERWSAKQAAPVAEALAAPAARAHPGPGLPRGAAEGQGAEGAGGGREGGGRGGARLRRPEGARSSRPGSRPRLRGAASRSTLTPRGCSIERMGESTVRLSTELDRLATWAAEGGRVEREDLEAMIADTSEEVAWALADALVERSPAGAVAAAERLAGQGEATTPLDLRGREAPARRPPGARRTRPRPLAEGRGVVARHAPVRGEDAGAPRSGAAASTRSGRPPARSPISSGGPGAGRTIPTRWR